jgi:hypothetical protein
MMHCINKAVTCIFPMTLRISCQTVELHEGREVPEFKKTALARLNLLGFEGEF